MAHLGDYIREECNLLGPSGSEELRLIGVSNEHGLHASSRDTSDDISRYQRIEKNWFAYNPMRVNVGSIGDAVLNVVGIWCGAISGNMKVSFQAARSIG